jgi:Fungal N-terminal domain of STAND proteins
MADPLSMVAAVLAITKLGISSALQVKGFIEGIQGAPRSITATSKDINALHGALHAVADFLSSSSFDSSVQSQLVILLKPPVENCLQVLREIENAVRPFTKPLRSGRGSKWRGFVWNFRERDIVAHQRVLTSYKSSLEIALSMGNLLISQSGFQDVKERIHHLQRNLNEYDQSSAASELGNSTIAGTDHGYALRRFLLETESILGGSPPGSPSLGPSASYSLVREDTGLENSVTSKPNLARPGSLAFPPLTGPTILDPGEVTSFNNAAASEPDLPSSPDLVVGIDFGNQQ